MKFSNRPPAVDPASSRSSILPSERDSESLPSSSNRGSVSTLPPTTRRPFRRVLADKRRMLSNPPPARSEESALPTFLDCKIDDTVTPIYEYVNSNQLPFLKFYGKQVLLSREPNYQFQIINPFEADLKMTFGAISNHPPDEYALSGEALFEKLQTSDEIPKAIGHYVRQMNAIGIDFSPLCELIQAFQRHVGRLSLNEVTDLIGIMLRDNAFTLMDLNDLFTAEEKEFLLGDLDSKAQARLHIQCTQALSRGTIHTIGRGILKHVKGRDIHYKNKEKYFEIINCLRIT